MWGCDLGKISTWGDNFVEYFLKAADTFIQNKTMQRKDDSFTLTTKGKLFADNIAMKLFFEI